MALTADEVARLAGLARIQVTEQECADLAPELETILTYVNQVARVADPDVPAMSHALALENVTRPDVVQPSLGIEVALAGAPDSEDGQFRVPQILSED